MAISVGRSDWDVDCAGQLSCKSRDTAWTLRGGYRFNPYLGIEARYFDLGKVSAVFPSGVELPAMTVITGEQQFSAKGVGVNAILTWPIADGFSISGIAGMARTTDKSTRSIEFDGSAESSDHGTKPYYGLNVA